MVAIQPEESALLELLVFFVKFVTITGQTSSASHAPRVSFVPGGTAGAQDVYS